MQAHNPAGWSDVSNRLYFLTNSLAAPPKKAQEAESGRVSEMTAPGPQLYWRPAEPDDPGTIMIPTDIFPQAHGSPIPIHVPPVIDASNAFISDGWETVKEISNERVRFSNEKLLMALAQVSSGDTDEPGVSLAYELFRAVSQAFERDGFRVSVQRSPTGAFRATIQISTDDGNAIRTNAGGIISSPANGVAAVAFSQYLQDRFSLPKTDFLYQGFWSIDVKHRKDPYVAYMSLSPHRNALVITPKTYSGDWFKVIKVNVTTLFGGPTALELKGQDYVQAWSCSLPAQVPEALKVLELLGAESVTAITPELVRPPAGSSTPTATVVSPPSDKPAEGPKFRQLSPQEQAQAGSLWSKAEAAKKVMNKGLFGEMNKRRMIDYCRKIIKQLPASEYATKAKQALASLPDKDRQRYGITDEEASIQK
jgi:hypothetical protein